jgi:hypothetical protein
MRPLDFARGVGMINPLLLLCAQGYIVLPYFGLLFKRMGVTARANERPG